jgi:cyclic pyranopterin phosphate synthase
MVDVSEKAVTKRAASAQAVLTTTPEVLRLLVAGELPKGEALAVARVAGIMGAKQTSALVPLCHPLPISSATIDFEPGDTSVRIVATVKTTGVTGVEMEALTAASVAALTLYDMIKAVDRGATITDLQVLAKSGGASGTWEREKV